MNAPYYNGDDDRDMGCSLEPQTCQCPECRQWRDDKVIAECESREQAWREGQRQALAAMDELFKSLI